MTDIEIKGVDALTSKQWVDEGKAVLIDVREQNEWDQANISGATLVPLSAFNMAALPKDTDKIAIFHCRSGQRTANYFGLFLETPFKEVYHMEGGIISWNEAGLPINSGD